MLRNMENIFYEGIRIKRRRRKKGPVILLLLLAAFLIGFGGYKISQKLLTNEEEEKE